ncbi:hypothetical protein LTS08_001944 [Lithohypha guttulata]|nr:hypothetical protein LTS08_001944 [Lithohypha guttulata]
MAQVLEGARVVPAQLDFLAIYNPTLGSSDESLKDQIVFFHSNQNRGKRGQAEDVKQKQASIQSEDEENEKLRQVGLAQGMVNFAKNFSDSNVDTIETEKSRIVLHELERDWWVLACIDLTRLPASKKPGQDDNTTTKYEYSAREVAPAPLLIAQLVQANSLFLLHNASSLTELLSRSGRDALCNTLDRFWTKFARAWDVLLHGNPASSIYSATKIAGGGELGIGVGEEEWGSGEREVLEGFIDRTEGLQDLVVGRYGLPPATDRPASAHKNNLGMWLGTGNDPVAADGVIFSGKGLLSRRSLCTVSQWMEAIFKYGEDAYGVSENPSSRRRPRRKRPNVQRSSSSGDRTTAQETHSRTQKSTTRTTNLRKRALENNTSPPGVPAPLVRQVENSLENALAKASADASRDVPEDKELQNSTEAPTTTENQPALFGAENMVKYLTLGYGTSWTLNPKGRKSNKTAITPAENSNKDQQKSANVTTDKDHLKQIEPTPEVTEDEQPFKQKLEQSIGRFVIGLAGDLEQAEFDIDEGDDDQANQDSERPECRLFLRTLTVEMAQPKQQSHENSIRPRLFESTKSTDSNATIQGNPEPKTSAAASVDGSQPNITHQKAQVAVYVHQPFIFVFLFQLHTPNLTMPSFYRSIHNQLGPLQRPLLRSTDPSRITERIAEGLGEKNTASRTSDASQSTNPIYDLIYDPNRLIVRTSIPNIPVPGSLAAEGLTSSTSSFLSVSGSWYTLGIPIGTSSENTEHLADSLVKSAWSRTEALNAHTQLLNTYIATRTGQEKEHTVKTARGWWVIWTKVVPLRTNKDKRTIMNDDDRSETTSSLRTYVDSHKEAFLVRKAADHRPTLSAQSRNLSSGPGKWLLREQKRDVSGASTVGAASARGVSEGVGVDTKKWIEGLLSLTQ